MSTKSTHHSSDDSLAPAGEAQPPKPPQHSSDDISSSAGETEQRRRIPQGPDDPILREFNRKFQNLDREAVYAKAVNDGVFWDYRLLAVTQEKQKCKWEAYQKTLFDPLLAEPAMPRFPGVDDLAALCGNMATKLRIITTKEELLDSPLAIEATFGAVIARGGKVDFWLKTFNPGPLLDAFAAVLRRLTIDMSEWPSIPAATTAREAWVFCDKLHMYLSHSTSDAESEGKGQAADDSVEEEPSKSPPRESEQLRESKGFAGLSGEARALATLTQHPEWTDTRIAEAADVPRTSLYRWPTFMAARAVQNEGKDDIPRGSKSADGTIEAIQPDE